MGTTSTFFAILLPLILGIMGVIISLIGKVFNFLEKDKSSKGYGIFAITANMVGIFGFLLSYFEYFSNIGSEFSVPNGLNIVNIVLFFSNLGCLINNIAVFREIIRSEGYEKDIKEYLKYCKEVIMNNNSVSVKEKTELCNIVGRYYFDTNQYCNAINYFQKTLNYNPKNKVAKEYLNAINQKVSIHSPILKNLDKIQKISSIPFSMWKEISNRSFLPIYYQTVADRIANTVENKEELDDTDYTSAMQIVTLVFQHEPSLLKDVNEMINDR